MRQIVRSGRQRPDASNKSKHKQRKNGDLQRPDDEPRRLREQRRSKRLELRGRQRKGDRKRP